MTEAGRAEEAITRYRWASEEDSSGFRATLDGNVEALSRRGEAVVVYRSINEDMSFAYARHGVLVRRFEPLMYEAMPQVGEPLSTRQVLASGPGRTWRTSQRRSCSPSASPGSP